MTLLLAPASTRQRLCVEFAALKHACPRGIYVAPLPGDSLSWVGVLFLRSGPYAKAVLKFQIDFPESYPMRLPVLSFQTDVFHPLVTPLTTYTYSTRGPSAETISAGDDQRLPPGGLALHHGFPNAYRAPDAEDRAKIREAASDRATSDSESTGHVQQSTRAEPVTPHIAEILHYLRIIFEVEDVIDSIPMEAAVNAGAWHAWRSYRSRVTNAKLATTGQSNTGSREASAERSTSPRQKPGGARRPGEWNWQGVWEDRVRKCIQASSSDAVLFGGGESNDLIGFVKMDPDALDQITSNLAQGAAESVA